MFFQCGSRISANSVSGYSIDFLQRSGCQVCTLNHGRPDLRNPYMEPAGSLNPIVYCLGEAPGGEEDRKGIPFVGPSGKLLRHYIPDEWIEQVRFNNVVRTRPENNRDPTPLEIECFPAGTMVQPIGRITALYRRWYQGPMLMIVTKGGHRLTGTPNHPIFTPQGRVPIQALQPGDKIFCTSTSDRFAGPRNPNVNYKPTPIEQVASSFSEPWKEERVLSAFDFHGDGIANSKVDIIRPNSFLRDYSDFWREATNEFYQKTLAFSNTTLRTLMNLSTFFTNVNVLPMVTAAGALSIRMGGIPGIHSSTWTTDCRPYLQQTPLDKHWFEPVSSAELFKTDATSVLALDEVESISRNDNFSDHVYNLETDSHQYIANGVLVSNCCRPSIVADIELTQPTAIFGLGNVPLRWAINRSGITNWAGRRMPIKVGRHVCWFFPMLHPSYVLHQRDEADSEYDWEFKFALDMRHAFEFLSQDEIPTPVVHSTQDALSNVEIVTGRGAGDLDRVIVHLRAAAQDKVVGLDYETNALRPYHQPARILTVAVARKDNSLAFPLYHPQTGFSEDEREELEKEFEDFLYNGQCRKVAHHLTFEQEWSAEFYGPECLRAGKWGDTECQAWVLDERRGMLSLDTLVLQYFGFNLKEISNLDTLHLADAPLDQVLTYNGLDSKYHRALYFAQMQELRQQDLMQQYEYMLARVPTMTLTQRKGVPIDQKQARHFQAEYVNKLNAVEEEIDQSPEGRRFLKLTGHEYRPGAPQDVRRMVLEILKTPEVENVNKKTLAKIEHPIVEKTLRWRGANKILSTYILPVLEGSEHVYPDGKLHPIMSLTQTRTSRTSSEDPNIQNYPKRQNREIRRVVGNKRLKVVSFDYGQIQARNVAMESLDKALIKAFWDRYDIHTDWMERIASAHNGWMPKGADKDEIKAFRNRSKNEFVFPSFFGAQPKSISRSLGVPVDAVTDLHDHFWEMFPHIKDWHERILADFNELGYVTGLTGFRRRAPSSPNEVINAPIQADEALIVCDAMNRLSELGDERLQANLEIHDDLTFLWRAEEIDELAEITIETMLSVPFEWANVVPIVVEMSVGDSWADLKEVGVYASDTWKKAKAA